jgi:hypothetical protein
MSQEEHLNNKVSYEVRFEVFTAVTMKNGVKLIKS